jgi:SAM-dependent methyltransferase
METAVRMGAREAYALWASTWDDSASPILALETRYVANWLDPLRGRRAIDIGCGAGRWTANLNALGFDASPEMLRLAAAKPGLHGRLAVASAESLPVATAAAGLAVCALTLAHVREWSAAFRELARILQPGGVLILTDFHSSAAERGWRRTFRRDGALYEVEHFPYRLDDLTRLASELGLQLDESLEAAFGEPERAVFARAGRPDLFIAAAGVPAVLLTRWTRQ